MQTHKKRFRKRKTIKKSQKTNQIRNRNKQFLKGLVCYKIRVIPKSNGGGVIDGPKFERLEEMVNKILSELGVADTNGDLKSFLTEIMNNKAKKDKIFNEIFTEDVFEPTDSDRDTDDEKTKKNKIREDSKNVKGLLIYLNNSNEQNSATDENYAILKTILLRKAAADKILKDILKQLDNEAVKKQLSPSQISAIKSKIAGSTGITGALSSITSKMSNGAVSLGNWLAPEVVDDSGIKKNLANRQKIKFLWYPRKHIDYRKGNSTPKRQDDDIEYGDFMVLIEPEEYANTGEFFRQTYHNVEDLLATLLMGCDGPFCVKGDIKREPYNWREYIIENNQPTVDRDKRNPQLVEK